MSPIGRVFIVLNLILAGTFVGYSGTTLQKQFHWKTESSRLTTALNELRSTTTAEIARLSDDVSKMTTSKSTLENELGLTKNELKQSEAEVARLRGENSQLATDVREINSRLDGIKNSADAANEKANAAYQSSLAALKDKDEAIREKDTAVAENRDLKNQNTALSETIAQKDLQLADASAEKGRLNLLVDVAKAKGFLESMAVPALAGTVSNVTGNLCTILVEASDSEIKPGYSFAIYDASGYKGEAKVTSVDAERRAAFCRLEIKQGEIKSGDKASTHLAGF